MITLDKNQRDIQIPDYNDLDNKPRINGVELSGDKSAGELGIVVDTKNYYTKSQSDNKFQPKGNYLTKIPSEYVTESELNDALKDIKIDASVDLTGYATEGWVSANYQTKGEYATVGYVDSEKEYLQGEIDAKQNILVSGGNIKTINGQTILGSGNIVIEGGSGGSTDLTGYATEDWVSANYQTKGNYLTEIPSEYVTESELQRKNFATKSEIPVVPTTISSFTNDSGYITNNALSDYATESWVSANYQTKGNYLTEIPSEYATEDWISANYQTKGDYLTEVPSEYVTETELNDAIAGKLDIPYVIITANNVGNAVRVLSGDLSAVLDAFKKEKPFIAYFYTGTGYEFNDSSEIGEANTYYPLRLRYVKRSTGYDKLYDNYFSYSTEYGMSGGLDEVAMDVRIEFDYTGKLASTVKKIKHDYLTNTYYNNYVAPKKQDKLISGTNIKTINGESILGSGDITIEGGESVAYLIIKENTSENTYSYIGGSFEDVVNAYNSNKPYFIYVPNGAGVGYYSLAETTIITDTMIQCLSFAHTGYTHTWRYWRLYSDTPTLYNQTTYEYATKSQLDKKQDTLVSGENIKTINGNSILGDGNIIIEGGSSSIPTMFIPNAYSGSVSLDLLNPIVDAVTNDKPWIVYGHLGIANGRYNMVECATLGDNTITFYDNSVSSDNNLSLIRYWTFNITDGTFVMEERTTQFATTSYVDEKIGDINTILENIIG